MCVVIRVKERKEKQKLEDITRVVEFKTLGSTGLKGKGKGNKQTMQSSLVRVEERKVKERKHLKLVKKNYSTEIMFNSCSRIVEVCNTQA